MKTKLRHILTFIGFLLIVFFVGLQSVKAQNSIGITIKPVKTEELVDPGQRLVKQLKVTNGSESRKTFFLYVRDFVADGEGGAPKFVDPGTNTGFSLSSWVEVNQTGINFNPKEEKTIPIIINVPGDADPGGYFGGVLVGTEPPKIKINSEDRGAAMSIAQQTASLILLQVKGDVKEEARIREFNTDKNFYSTPFNVEFLIRIENLGNVQIRPRGNIIIENMLDKEVASVQVNNTGTNVLPGQIRRYTTNWESRTGIGKYKAKLGLSYGTSVESGGQGKQTLYTEKEFWIIPWRIIIPTLLGITLVVALFVFFLKLYKNKAVRKAMEQAGLRNVRYVKKYQGTSPALHFGLILLIVLILLFIMIMAGYFLFFA